jgi:FKBP-type peptidyl-prolyl cis-trans isomerase FkpA
MFAVNVRLVFGRRVSLLVLAAAAAACSSPTTPSYVANVPFNSTDVVVGTGDESLVGKVVVVDYAGWLYDGARPDNKGSLFDTSLNRSVFTFLLGSSAVIRGWEQGVPGMRVGGQRRLIIPPDLAYGSTGNGPIPPNATLVFDIWLLGVFDQGQVPQAASSRPARPPL